MGGFGFGAAVSAATAGGPIAPVTVEYIVIAGGGGGGYDCGGGGGAGGYRAASGFEVFTNTSYTLTVGAGGNIIGGGFGGYFPQE